MKKIKQWFCGLFVAFFGAVIIYCFVALVFNFMAMMCSTGREFVGYFISFAFDLVLAIFLPYFMFQVMKDGVNDKFK